MRTVLLFLTVTVCSLLFPASLQAEDFFASPRRLVQENARFPRFFSRDGNLGLMYQEIVPRHEEGEDIGGDIYLSYGSSETGEDWTQYRRILGPFPYQGRSVPLLFSVTQRDDTVFVAVTVSPQETVVYRTPRQRWDFEAIHRIQTDQTDVAPTLITAADGTLILFVNRNVDGRQQIVYQRSSDGNQWSETRQFEEDPEIGLSFLPRHAKTEDRDYILFQGINITRRSTYQLYVKYSDDGGDSWSATQRITTFTDRDQTEDPDLYDNQRGNIAIDPTTAVPRVVWERRYQTGNPQIYMITLGTAGEATSEIEEITGRFEISRAPRLIFDQQGPAVTWFGTTAGNSRIFLSRPGLVQWNILRISEPRGEAVSPDLTLYQNRLHMTWEVRSTPPEGAIVYLEPDQRVAPPGLVPLNVSPGERSAQEELIVRVEDPADPSGIAAFSYVWSQDAHAPVPRVAMLRPADRRLTLSTDADGPWYLRVRAQDRAGNWSEVAAVSYVRDTTPPGPVRILPPPLDERGFLTANTFTVRWLPPDDEEFLLGYRTRLDFVSSDPAAEFDPENFRTSELTLSGRAAEIQRNNAPDGLWVLSVAAVDSVGNAGPPTRVPLRLNKFIPRTVVHGTSLRRNEAGQRFLSLVGGGFSTHGTIERVHLRAPESDQWEYTFYRQNGDFVIVSDTTVADIPVSDIPPGAYRIGLQHRERGMYVAPTLVQFDPQGVVQFGPFQPWQQRGFEGTVIPTAGISPQGFLFFLVLAVGFVLIGISSLRLVSVTRDIQRFNGAAYALVTGRDRDKENDMGKEIARMKTRGFGLRIKFAFFVVLLVISVVLVVAVALGRTILERQESLLIAGLQERIELLLDGQVTGARGALENPAANTDQLQTLTEQARGMRDSHFVTITGIDRRGDVETVFATSDQELVREAAGRIDTEEYVVGLSRMNDTITPRVRELATEMNAAALGAIGDIPAELNEVSRRAQQRILEGAGEDELAAIDQVRSALLSQARGVLQEISGPIRSEPAFDPSALSRDVTDYVFFRPVLDVPPGAGADFQDFYRGTVRVGISTQLIIDEISATTEDLIQTTVMVAVIAVVLGIAGAYVLATIIVIPIRRLVSLVELIAMTEDKATLKGTELQLKGHDELQLLATSINTMTTGLVRAAEADKDLLFGKETQKAFIPLQRIRDDSKRSYGDLSVPEAYFFGYYEGAKGVSGDYFTYQQLSERYFAMIKCDVAGKGIPAALIMVQVATVFTDYFRGWTEQSPGLDLSAFILRVNDVVADQQFKGRFAALTAGILDVKTGTFHVANAGDNQLHLFRHSPGRVEQQTIPGGPASGMFSSREMPVSFPQQKETIHTGDMLLLFTDGLEESKRTLRDAAYQPIQVTAAMVAAGAVPDDMQPGQGDEEFSNQRIHDIVQAVQERGQYTLHRLLSPPTDEPIVFDFSSCAGGARDVTLAVIAAERMFRLYRDNQVTVNDRVTVDVIVDDFLRSHLVGYQRFFQYPAPPGEGGEYRTYQYLKEDGQYDDLTFLTVEKL
jgi:hypothetical protein